MISILRRMKSFNSPPTNLFRLGMPAIIASMIGLLLLIVLVWPVSAAVKLDFFVGQSTADTLVLEWATSVEQNLLRWEVYCKDELQLPAAYHLIGGQEAVGEGGNGGFYSFPVPDLTPGASYCFRITEITTDASSGQSYEICGFGYGVTPTPSPTATPTSNEGVVSSGTAAAPNMPISGDGIVPPESAPTSTPTPMPTEPLPTSPPAAASTLPPLDESSALTETGASPPTSLQMGQDSQTTATDSEGGRGTANIDAVVVVPPVPDPGYIVVTATPTAEAVAMLQPTFTPLPTATAEPAALIAGLSDWNADNLVLAALCFVFFGAGGLGVLGITSLGLYVRSRSEAQNTRRSPFNDYRR